jgi:GxxExxY protein
MGILFQVHNQLGPGLLEKHYQRAIAIELEDRRINFEMEKLVTLKYMDKSIGRYFVDFVIDNKVVIKVKATRQFGQQAFKQAYSYLRELNLPLAIVINFHDNILRYKRIVNPRFRDKILE